MDEEIETCDILEINKDVINEAKKIKVNYLATKDRLFQIILEDVLLIIESELLPNKISE